MSLQAQLAALDPAVRARLDARGFDPARLAGWASTLGGDPRARNRLPHAVGHVPDDWIRVATAAEDPEHGHQRAVGIQALSRGEVALCVLAGGMATRMGGVVKALVEALPGRTFLDIRLAELDRLARDHGCAPHLWLMTSEPTDGPIRDALGDRGDGERVATFEQFVSLRLTPGGELLRDAAGQPSVYATGHGDLPDALSKSGLLERFNAAGGRYVWIGNLDNLGSGFDAALLGQHIARGSTLTVEVAPKHPGDRGGGPVMHAGKPIIAESFRVPPEFDQDAVPVFNTNTFLVDSHALASLDMAWTYLEVHKQVEGRTAVQFERLIGEMTMALDTSFVRVPREGAACRFAPVKDRAALEAARPLIEAIARGRGVL